MLQGGHVQKWETQLTDVVFHVLIGEQIGKWLSQANIRVSPSSLSSLSLLKSWGSSELKLDASVLL